MTHPTVVSHNSTGDAARSGTSFDLNIPAASSSGGTGDTLLAFLTSEHDTAGAFSPGAGWSVLYDLQVFASGLDNPITALCMYKKASGSEGSTETITVQNAWTGATCYRMEDAADPTVTPPEYVFTTSSGDSTPRVGPLFPTAKKIDDYIGLRGHHSTRNKGTGAPYPDGGEYAAGDALVISCYKEVTGFSWDDGAYFSGFTTFWSAGDSRVVVYPATSFTHPADNFPHIQAVNTSDETDVTGSELALQLPASIASGDILLAILTQDQISASSSDGIVWPAGWSELYVRPQSVGNIVGAAAWKRAAGTEGASVNMTVNAGEDLAAIVYRMDNCHDSAVLDFEFHEASAAFDSVRWDTLAATGGSGNYLWIAGAHLPNQPRITAAGGNYANYESFGRVDSDGGVASFRFGHRAVQAASEAVGTMDMESEGEYLSVVFAIQGDSPIAPNLRTSQVAAATLIEQGGVDARVTQVAATVLANMNLEARITQVAAAALVTSAPCKLARCQVWKITRTDGIEFRFTTHDKAVTMAGEVYEPCDSLRSTAVESGILNAQGGGDVEIGGLISDTKITESDMANGLFDGASIEVWRVPWDDPTYASDSRVRIMFGVLGSTSQNGTNYTAEFFNHSLKLAQRPLLDTYTPACRFEPGDGRCPLDVNALQLTGKVISAADRIAIYRQSYRQFFDPTLVGYGSSSCQSSGAPLSGTSATAVKYVVGGLLTWTTGANAGIQSEVKAHENCVVTLWDAMPHEIVAGDQYTLKPGCNKTASDHADKFGLSMESFGGFPDIPGADAIIRGPDS